MNNPDIIGILQMLISRIQPNLMKQHSKQRTQHRQPNGQMGKPGQMPMPNQMPAPPMMMHGQQPPPGMMNIPPQMNPAMQGAPIMGQPPMGPMPGRGPMPPMGAQGQMTPAPPHVQMYLGKTLPLIGAVVVQNPQYKNQVGEAIYEFVEQLAGENAPKVTGMLIDLPIEEIRQFMQDYNRFQDKVNEANQLLKQGQ